MRNELEVTKPPVKVKKRKYPNYPKKFLDKYTSNLLKMGFIKPCTQVSWIAAPHLVSINSKSLFRTTIDLRPVNAATKTKKRSVNIIEAELSGFQDSKHFASMEFCAEYWQFTLDPESYDACSIIAPQGAWCKHACYTN